MEEGIKKLRKKWNDDPEAFIFNTMFVVAGATAVYAAYAQAASQRAYARQVRQNIRNQRNVKFRL